MLPTEVYLDYNATTPLEKPVLDIIHESLENLWQNPSSNYSVGTKCRNAIENARKEIADMLNTKPEFIIFTSGGTESNNMVLNGVLSDDEEKPCHVVCSAVEHCSILNTAKELQSQNKLEFSVLEVDETGVVKIDKLRSLITPKTKLVSVMLANNETGVIQPIEEIGSILKREFPHVYLHSDVSQAIGKLEVNVDRLGVDFATLTGHKFYGPRMGVLFARRHLKPMIYGGNQESQIRPGTENLAYIVGLGKAATLVKNNLTIYANHMKKMRDMFETRLKAIFGENVIIIHGEKAAHRLPNTSMFTLPFNMPQTSQICISRGAACHSCVGYVSPILKAMNVTDKDAERAIRLSTGRLTTESEIEAFIEFLNSCKNQNGLN